MFLVMGFCLSWVTAFAFVTGGILSAAAGYVGMYVATRANTRTTHAAEDTVAKALKISFRSGLTMGLCVASFALMGLSIWLILLVFGVDTLELMKTHVGMVEGFATGASSVALFARVGGGVYTKAADVGADLVGKVEAGIPEDDPRNPATIADNVGDNVGDVAGMGADLFESYTGSIIAPTILAVTLASLGYFGAFGSTDMIWATVVPLVISACGIITSICGPGGQDHFGAFGSTETGGAIIQGFRPTHAVGQLRHHRRLYVVPLLKAAASPWPVRRALGRHRHLGLRHHHLHLRPAGRAHLRGRRPA